MHTFANVGYPKVRKQIQAISLAATDEVDEPRRRGVGGAERLAVRSSSGAKVSTRQVPFATSIFIDWTPDTSVPR